MAETVSDIKGEKSNLTFKNEARWENVLASRILRIFLSSTFRDMQRERDTFFQHGEPRLREWARKKGVILHFIDLRWGLTREVSDNGEVTIRCYQSIEQCPYFVCTLGARYGWIPDHSNPSEWHPDTDKHYPFLNELGHLSVTHYEIQYGALMQKAIARKSFFYERDENHVLTSAPDLTPEERVLYQAVNMKDKINQDAMKQEISLQYQIKVYKDSKQLSEWIVDDLITSMEVDFAGISAAPDDEDFAHEQLMRHRLNGFKGRDDTIQQLRANIDRQLITKGSKIAMIFGEPGVGKTSTMAAFVQQLEINPKLCVFYHFAGCSSVSLLVDSIVQRIYRSLFHRKVLSNAPDTEIGQETIKKGLYEVLRQASKKANIRVVVILDGVDQLVDSPAYPHVHQLHWLPKLLPRNVAMVISTTKEHASYPVAQSAGFDAVSLLPLTAPEVLQVADAYMFGYDKTLSLVQKDMILRDIRDCSHPLYLRIILEELRVFGIYETVNKELEDLLSTNGVIELFTIVLKRWEQKYDTILVLSSDIAFSLVRTVVSVLCISRMGLNDDELDSYVNYRFGKKLQGEEVSVWKSFFFKLLDSLYVRNGRYTFIHRLLEEAAKLRYLSNPDLELYEMRAYGSWLLERFDFDQQEAPTVAEICHTLSYSRDYPKLAEFLSKQKVVDAMLGGRHKYEFYSHWRVLNKNGFDHKSVYQDMLKDTSSTGDYLVSYFQDVQERDFLVPIIHDRISMRTNEDEKLVDYGWLASVYDDMAQYEKSLEYYRKAIAIKIKKFGEKHTSVAHSYNNMGGVYCSMGKYNRAHEYHRKSLAIKTKLLGEGHMDVATSYCNVAIVYINQGMFDLALENYQRALPIYLKELGEEHPDVANVQNNIGEIYRKMGRYPEALERFHNSVEIKTKSLGEDHASVAASYNNIASVYYSLERHAMALDYFRKSLAIKIKSFGTEHPSVANTYNNMANVYDSQGQYATALEYYNKDVIITEKVLGHNHPSLADTYYNIASTLEKQQKWQQSHDYYLKAKEIYIKAYGKTHSETTRASKRVEFLKSKLPQTSHS